MDRSLRQLVLLHVPGRHALQGVQYIQIYEKTQEYVTFKNQMMMEKKNKKLRCFQNSGFLQNLSFFFFSNSGFFSKPRFLLSPTVRMSYTC